ncbi:MAG: HAMP domain-containing sensor histidine kinase [Chloroflexota bacterium]
MGLRTMFGVHQVHWASAKLAAWMVAAPLPGIDRYLLAIRWAALLGVSVIILGTRAPSVYAGFYGEARFSPLAMLPLAFGYNLILSPLIWHKRPLARGRAGWLIVADLFQATLLTGLTGGLNSIFFILFPIAMVEAALTCRWPAAAALSISIAALHLIVALAGLGSGWDSAAVANLTARTFVILTLGALVTLFSGEMRSEEAARRQAAEAVSQAAVLNEIFLRLGEDSLEPERILSTILDGIQILPAVAFGLVLLPEPNAAGPRWQVAASTTTHHPRGEQIPDLTWADSQQLIFTLGRETNHPLPDFMAGDAVDQLICGRLIALGRETLGLIVVGRRPARPLSEAEHGFLRTLVMEAGLALRNAQLYSREQNQVARLRQFEERQSVFFSAISHELKTPLTVLKTLAPSLRRLPELPAATQTEIIDRIEQNLSRLELLIIDLLESSRLETNAVALHLRPVNLSNRVRRVLDSLTPLLERKHQQVNLSIAPDLPPVWAEGRRVEQILSNLLNNAAKFAPRHSIIDIELSRVGDKAQVCVVDAGPGVAVEDRERIFDKFYIAAQDKALAGVGLGLFICRELVRLHDGRIWLEDRPGGGSRFCFTLPLAIEDRRP